MAAEPSAHAVTTDSREIAASRWQRIRLHLRRAALAGVCFALGFTAVAGVLSHLVEPIRVRKVSDKIEVFHAVGDEFDTVFLGSSRTGRQIIPAEFDRAMAAAGLPTRSFNLGLEGLRPPEDTVVLEKALAKRTKPLKYLIVECNPLESLMIEEDKWTTRAIFTHDAKRMGVYWRHLWALSLDEPFDLKEYRRRLQAFGAEYVIHAMHYIWNAGRVSRGSELLLAKLTGKRQGDKLVETPTDGYYLRETEFEPMAGAELKRYMKYLARQKAEPPRTCHWDIPSQRELLEKKAWADKLGAQLVLVSPPFLKTRNFAPRERHGLLFLDFSDANRFPEFHEPENRRDYGHLSDAAAKTYSQAVANGIAAASRTTP